VIEAEILLCRAEAGDAGCVAGLAAGDVATGWRGFVGLVNAGALAAAEALRQKLGEIPQTLPAALRRDALLSRANLALAPGGEPQEALVCARALADGRIMLAAFVRLVNAGRYREALAVAAEAAFPALDDIADEAMRDARLALAVLDLETGDPALVPARLEGLALPPSRREVLLLDAFVRLVNAGRFAEAAGFAAAHEVAALARQVPGHASADAAAALAVTALAMGHPDQVPAILQEQKIEPARREALLCAGFTGLVNAGRLAAAELFLADWLAGLEAMAGPEAADARRAALLLDLQQARAMAALERLERLEQDREEGLAPLRLECFLRLVNEGAFAAARRLEPGFEGDALPDVTAARLVLALQPGGEKLPERLAAAAKSGVLQARPDLALAGFVALVNAAHFAPAQDLLPFCERALTQAVPPYRAAIRDLLFAAGMLFLQEPSGWPRSAATFARLREDFCAAPPRHPARPAVLASYTR
jgi:hypothetical protein